MNISQWLCDGANLSTCAYTHDYDPVGGIESLFPCDQRLMLTYSTLCMLLTVVIVSGIYAFDDIFKVFGNLGNAVQGRNLLFLIVLFITFCVNLVFNLTGSYSWINFMPGCDDVCLDSMSR